MIEAMLDTNMVSELMRNPRGRVRQRLESFGVERVCVSIISAGELWFGIELRRSDRVRIRYERIAAELQVVDFASPAHQTYGRLRSTLHQSGRPIGPNDLFIAAHALTLDLTMVTANLREFSRVPNLRVENWLD